MSWAANDYVNKLTETPTGKAITPGQKLVLILLSNHHNDDTWEAEVSLNSLATRSLLTKSYVVKVLAAMEKEDLLESITGRNERLGNLTKRYLFKQLPRPSTVKRHTTMAWGASELSSPPPSELSTLGVVKSVHQASELSSPPPSELQPRSYKESSLKSSEKEKKHSLSGKPDGGGSLVVVAEEILEFLNQQAGRNFQARTPNNQKLTSNLTTIIYRLKEGWKPEQLKGVVSLKVRKWKGDAERSQFLRPETLFGERKFTGYVGELADRQQMQRAQEARSRTRIETGLTKAEPWEPSEADKEALRNAVGMVTVKPVQTSGPASSGGG